MVERERVVDDDSMAPGVQARRGRRRVGDRLDGTHRRGQEVQVQNKARFSLLLASLALLKTFPAMSDLPPVTVIDEVRGRYDVNMPNP